MDINQISQLVSYLDAERRKDKTLITQLQERIEGLSREVEARTRYSQTLETTLNELKLQLARAQGWTTAVEQVRNEFSQLVERMEDQRSKGERELARNRQVEIESLTRQLNEIKKEVKPYGGYAETLTARQTEDARLADLIGRTQVQLMELERRFDQPTATLNFLEEQRRQDAKRVVSLEQELPELRKKIDGIAPRLLLMEESIRKKASEIEEAAKVLDSQNQLIESQRVADLRRERQFAEYAELIERLKLRADEIQSQVTGYYQMRDEVKRELAQLPDYKDQIDVRVNELAEIQREGEDRAKRVAGSFREEMDKQWKTFVVAQEERWHERDRRISDFQPRIDEIEEDLSKLEVLIPPLYEILDAFSRTYASAGREWMTQASQMIDRAKSLVPSETKPSRRQRRKQQAQLEQADKNGNADQTDLDADLVK
jgi:chromosome segregation ATPase